ncbi:MAG: HDIG domain-containing protein [Candidatus Karelsulcia muelleri]|nr:MAG: HDIG domain-containing protein [Candidatus Karelsulcia muelleri]
MFYEKNCFFLNFFKYKINNLYKKNIFFLENISNISFETARYFLIKFFKKEKKKIFNSNIEIIFQTKKKQMHFLAKKIIIQSIQKLATSFSIENSISLLNLDSLKMKGKLIGKNGENLRFLENLTGVEIIIDENPEYILLSSFNPIRREIAKLAIVQLILHGRINPSRIEEMVFYSEKKILNKIFKIGKKSLIEMGIRIIHPEFIQMVGTMKFRSSYGQNLLEHSREVANLASILSSEIGLNVKFAKRAGLLHDIGKVSDIESELSHALLGMNLAKKFGEHPYICNSIGSHHDEIEMKSFLSPLIQISDTISSSRPGIRRKNYEFFLKRLNEIENLAMNFNVVKKAFALQSGKELRVIVESEKIDEKKLSQLSCDLFKKIKTEIKFPGELKITIIRENQVINLT